MYPFKQKSLEQYHEICNNLNKECSDLLKIIAELRNDLNLESDSMNRIKLNTEIIKKENRKQEIDGQLKELEAQINHLEQEIHKDKDKQGTDRIENVLTYAQQQSTTSSVNEKEQTLENDYQFQELLQVSEKSKSVSELDNVDSTPESVKAESLFKNDEPIENTVLYTASFFPQLGPHEFDIVVSFLLKEQPPLSLTIQSKITTDNGEVKIIETQEKKPLIEVWKNSLNQPDKFLGKCYLQAVRLEDSSLVIDFSLPHLRKELKEYLEEQQPLYVENQFKRVQILLFVPSPKIATSAIELTIQMAIYHPDIYRENWLLAIILELTEEADWNIDVSLKNEQKLHKMLAEIEAEQRRNIVFTRISFLIYKMLKTSQLKGVAENFMERLISEQRYDAVLAIVKDLYSVAEFKGLYWVKQLLDRGNGEIRSDAYKFLFNLLKQSSSKIYEILELIKEWLPSSNRSPESYSRSNEYALQLLVEYCLETTSKLDEKYYGDWPSKYQLFVPLHGSDADKKIAIIISWLFHPDNEGNLALKHIVDNNINPIHVIGGLIADWFMILQGLDKKEPAPEAAELVNKLLRQIIQTINRSRQAELIQVWTYLTEYFLSASELQGQSGNFKLKRQLSYKRNLVRQLNKQFKSLQITNLVTKKGD
ncbi:hypothetical protein [Nostoc sp. ChiQUE01b]|uniref:hypothetical protein n=1 Tax=Nostoc sp. ChiQUE01b TaxID=3075376 RepID=UPI002AD37636|nr:hypothetical protein [Nostoc sp. ChiQUE01b]MDZ8260410.1 hypothetical protein [Nostoc sp. ChiQUE01b]